MFNGWKITNILDVGLCELDTAAMKAGGVWPETISMSWIKMSRKSGPGSFIQTDTCRRHGMGPEMSVRKCTSGKPYY
jgi:hypothetical protein